MKPVVQLVTYPDSLGGSLQDLSKVLAQYFNGFFGGIHILPPFPSSGDRGFAPKTYFEIDPAFGQWTDLRVLSEQAEIMVDLMVNHISRHSIYFKDFERLGRSSPYADLFITLDKIWPDGKPLPGDIEKIFLRRPEHPFADVIIQANTKTERVWATFGTRDWSEQIDLDVQSNTTKHLFEEILKHFVTNGIRQIRLDAVAFVVKKPGTSCFFVEPEIYDFLEWISQAARTAGIQLLLEVHAHHSIQDRLAARGYWVYNFALPSLVLHTLTHRSSSALRNHLKTCPHSQVTMLDCHDGIPIQPDIDDLLEIEDARRLVDLCQQRGANLSRIFSPQHHRVSDFDAHQVNCTYYSALAENDDAYISARAIQFFAPGTPQVYYNGLLAGKNTPDEIQGSGDRRAINRHNYTHEEIALAVQKPVVQRLLQLIHFRNTCQAFQGDFRVLDTNDHQLGLQWVNGNEMCTLNVDLLTDQCQIMQITPGASTVQINP